ncbi:hypothetical protein [Ponticaulis koreensis]|uniref:hypothetical protein n=1 Tax=Ponticaulis koreensis TaxID=1123045 RepID=UPI0003B2F876|nr:hypothetical protein [Ponticaulis koreensis]
MENSTNGARDETVEIEENKPPRLLTILTVIGAIACVGIVLIYVSFFFSAGQTISSSTADWGTFGDYLGGTLNPILSFLALIALLFTIKLQLNELRISRQELRYTRSELAGSKRALEEQNRKAEKDIFIQVFFNIFKELQTERKKHVTQMSTYSGLLQELEDRLKGAKDNTKRLEIIKSTLDNGGGTQRCRVRVTMNYLNLLLSHIIFHWNNTGDIAEPPECKLLTRTLLDMLSPEEKMLVFYIGFDPEFTELRSNYKKLNLYSDFKPDPNHQAHFNALKDS